MIINSSKIQILIITQKQQKMDDMQKLVYKIRTGRCSIEFFRKLVDTYIDINYKTKYSNYTLLMLASEYAKKGDNQEIVQLLIDKGADINLQDWNGWTALHKAARFSRDGSTENVVKMLIDAGANLDLKTKYGTTALMASATADGFSPNSTVRTVRMLIEAGADLAQKDDYGTALKYALAYPLSINIVRILIDAGADIDERDDSGKTVLMCVVSFISFARSNSSFNTTEIITVLIEANYSC